MHKFLTAKWNDLIMVNYEVAPELLKHRVPAGTELDLYEGRCFVSLVGFMFLDTRILGVPIPFHTKFEEINLRFYVRRIVGNELRRGVVFIKEIVPRYAIATVARVVYGEPYECWQTSNARTTESIVYRWSKAQVANSIGVGRGDLLGVPSEASLGSFIIEHYWGYTRRRNGLTDEYMVKHPKWELYAVRDERIDVDFGAVYGAEFSFLSETSPFSVNLAAGSPISVYKGHKIR